MAHLKSLLRIARIGDKRQSASTRSGMERALQALLGAGCAYALYRQIGWMITASSSGRLSAARLVALCLCIAWMLVLLSVHTSMPVSALAIYPLSRTERAIYLVCSYLQKTPVAFLCIASLLTLGADRWVPRPLAHLAGTAGLLLLSVLLSFSLSAAGKYVSRIGHQTHSRRRTTPQPVPLFRKELTYFTRTLDPYLALLLSIAVGYSEYLAGWLTPLRLVPILLMIAMFQSAAVVHPFALDAPCERERYRLLPVPYRFIVLQKHFAMVTIFVCTAAPTLFSVLLIAPLLQFVFSVLILGLVLLGWLSAGLLLMRTAAARRVRMSFGTLSGEGMSLELAAAFALLVSVAPALLIVSKAVLPRAFNAVLAGFLALWAIVYTIRLRALGDQEPPALL